jgi:ribosome recycling factor
MATFPFSPSVRTSLVKSKDIGQDDEKKGVEEIQSLTDQYTVEIDVQIKEKEAEIMEV